MTQDRQEIRYDTEAGVVQIRLLARGGIVLVEPIVITIAVDDWLAAACLLIQGQIQDRALVSQGLARPKLVQG
jgi:hypothetical protein